MPPVSTLHQRQRGRADRLASTLPVIDSVCEDVGRGITGIVAGQRVAIGTASFVAAQSGRRVLGPADVTFVAAGSEWGWIRMSPAARAGIERAAARSPAAHELCLISGDHDGERSRWQRLFGRRMHFRQTPDDKLAFISGRAGPWASRADGRRRA